MENQYSQMPADVIAAGNDSQPVTTGRWCWLKKGVALSVSCMVLLAIVSASTSTSTLHSTSAAEATSLFGLTRSLRSPFGGAVKSDITKPMGPQGVYVQGLEGLARYGIPVTPMAKLAITAIQANHLENQGVRDVSLKAQMQTILANEVDLETKKELREKAAEAKREAAKMKKEERLKEMAALGIQEDPENMAGVTNPTGYFDPLGFSTGVSQGRLLFLREAELKHGRVCMLASLGIFTTDSGFHPLFGGDIDVPAYVAFQQTPLQTFWVAVLISIGLFELPSVDTFNWPANSNEWTLKDGRVPGDFNFDPLGLKPKDPEGFKDLQTKEINNGRLAMLAAAGMIAQQLVDGNKIHL